MQLDSPHRKHAQFYLSLFEVRRVSIVSDIRVNAGKDVCARTKRQRRNGVGTA